jgi:hypothetical protein
MNGMHVLAYQIFEYSVNSTSLTEPGYGILPASFDRDL